MKGTARRMLLLAVATAGLLGVTAPASIASVSASAQAPASISGTQAQTITIQAVSTADRAKKIVCAISVSKPNYESPSHRKVATVGVVACSSRVVGDSVLAYSHQRPQPGGQARLRVPWIKAEGRGRQL